MAVLQRVRDLGCALFFLVHLAASLLMDTQLLLPRSLFPPTLVDLLDKYVKDYKDPLMGNAPTWYLSFMYLEVIFMVPFLIVGFFGALFGARWMRIPSIIYGTALAVMAIPMSASCLFDNFTGLKVGPTTEHQRLILGGKYAAFCLVGTLIVLDNALLRGGTQRVIAGSNKLSQKKEE